MKRLTQSSNGIGSHVLETLPFSSSGTTNIRMHVIHVPIIFRTVLIHAMTYG